MKKILLASLVPAIVGCAGLEPDPRATAIDEFRAANYQVARQHIEKALAEHPNDPELQSWAELIRHAARIDDARTYVFQQREADAIAILEALIREHGASETAQAWLDKAKLELCKRKTDEGQELLDLEKLPEAEVQFKEALKLWPGFYLAERGIARIDTMRKRKVENADRHYSEGLRAKDGLRWPKADYNAGASLESVPGHIGAKRLQQVSERELAEARRELAKQLFEQHAWAAAARRYEQAAELAKTAGLDWVDEAKKMAEQMKIEARAAMLFLDAEMQINKAQFDKARDSLEKATKLTEHDLPRANLLEFRLLNKQTEVELQRALELKADGRYEQALELLRDVAKRSPYSNAAGHIQTILEIQARAQELYDQATKLEKEGKAEDARALWRELREIHPRFKDQIAATKLKS